ncbi:uncharacterized protein LOC131067563 isoform X2 [Cryptomeria japonica]|uniref:uncharacterized protein LOC131067563 isoform X2 n=1 Tax=Cryptomeria japonica TaxID=3369 RepID=UPI0027DA5880|nr:uncharacterized protein LOC131067563 isoform X2 [Cryptomeria japonica]
MCGIGLILSGIHIVSSSSNLFDGFKHADSGIALQGEERVLSLEASGTLYPTVDDIKDVISRRGPDHVGLKTLHLGVVSGHESLSIIGERPIESEENNYHLDEASYRASYRSLEVNEKLKTSAEMIRDFESQNSCCQMDKIESSSEEYMNKYSASFSDINQAAKHSIVHKFVEGINGQTTYAFQENTCAEMLFVGATLQLRGVHPLYQPLVDTSTNILVYNGEIFGGMPVGKEENDAIVLMNALQRCCSCACHSSRRYCHCCHQKEHISVPELLSTIKGPWSLIYWQAKSNIVWFGRDAFGRRSLLVHWPSLNDSRLLLSSAAPFRTDKNTRYRRDKVAQNPTDDSIEGRGVDDSDDLEYWDELACGIYSISLDSGKEFGYNEKKMFVSIVGKVEKLDWFNPQIKKLLNWERCFVVPGSNDNIISNFTYSHGVNNTLYIKNNDLISSVIEQKDAKLAYVEYFDQNPMKSKIATADKQENTKMIFRNDASQLVIDNGLESKEIQLFEGMEFLSLNPLLQQNHAKEMTTSILQDSFTCSAQRVLFALKQAVMRRTCHSHFNQTGKIGESIKKQIPVAVLFSGGLDSMILAALLHQCLDHNCEIDLLNVSFDGPHAPDRISAKAGVSELQRIAAFRRWHLVEIDADPSKLQSLSKYLTSIINPAKTYMDLNIGTALWLAACGDGWVEEEEFCQGEDECHFNESHLLSNKNRKFKRTKYKSEARILFVGSGADEQCAGYGRHRTKFRLGGWLALQEEMKVDVQRIWKRNLGRDDRCMADHGKEARFPFLDEDLMETLLDLPLWEIADLEKSSGQGDKKILRQVAMLLGLEGASTIPKRAIQFGSRIARESNRRNFGSNRAANQAAAGSAMIHSLTK